MAPPIQTVRCPDCGSDARRHYLSKDHLLRIQCQSCDYLMVTCTQTGRVVETYSVGFYAHNRTDLNPSVA